MKVLSLALVVIAYNVSAHKGAGDEPNPKQNRSEISGNYSGTVSARGPNDTLRSQQIHLKLRQRGSRITGSLGPKVDDQFPIEDGVIDGDRIRFTAKLGPGTIQFHLTVTAGVLEGDMKTSKGTPPPFTRLSVKKVGELTPSDLVAPLPYEGTVRSPRLLRLRLELADGNTGALADFWREVEKTGTPLIEPVRGDEGSFFTTFVWRGAPETQNVLVLWQPLCFHQPDKFLMDHVERTDLWFRTI
jgi:hypothetical protein